MDSVAMLAHIARALGPLVDKVVFVGGSTVPFYLTDPGAMTARPTEDVDCVVEVVSLGKYYEIEAELGRLGFVRAVAAGDPICRWKYQGLTADIMPSTSGILGFSNKWYSAGCANSLKVALPGGGAARIFSLPYFLASKIEAFLGRGNGNFLFSPDMEDIITVLDGAETAAAEIAGAPDDVRVYLAERFREFLGNERFAESLEGNLRSPSGTAGRVERIRRILAAL